MKSSASPAGGLDRWWKKRWRAGWPAGLIALSTALAGCQSAPPHMSLLQASYRPNNIFVYPPKLSVNIQRVAVLPLAAESADNSLPEGCEALTPVLWDQLVKVKRFEVVAVDAAKLHSASGRAAWTGGENLPADFLAFLRREYGCDGVLFTELTTYRAYAPMAVGWRLKLVDARTGQIIWAVDELFDAAKPSVAYGLEKFTHPGFALPFCAQDDWLAVNSPDLLGRYSAAALLNTLPAR